MVSEDLKEQHMSIIKQMLKNAPVLHPRMFNNENRLYPYIRSQLLNMTDYAIDSVFAFFPKIKLLDIVLSGSVCSYTYTQNSDLDIFIVVDDLTGSKSKVNGFVLDNISRYFSYQNFKPCMFGHPVDFGFSNISKYMRFYKLDNGVKKIYAHNTYSLLNDKWICQPERLEYPFTIDQLYENYLKFEQNMENFVSSLPHADADFLTKQGIEKLKKTLSDLKSESFMAKEHDIMHEYSMVYNTYRVAKRLKLIAKYYEFAENSQKNLLSSSNKS